VKLAEQEIVVLPYAASVSAAQCCPLENILL
jgi:hypothetical protein